MHDLLCNRTTHPLIKDRQFDNKQVKAYMDNITGGATNQSQDSFKEIQKLDAQKRINDEKLANKTKNTKKKQEL